MKWADVLIQTSDRHRDRAALTALMWQAVANAPDEMLAAQATLYPSISLEGLADILDFHRLPVLPAALALIASRPGGMMMPIASPV